MTSRTAAEMEAESEHPMEAKLYEDLKHVHEWPAHCEPGCQIIIRWKIVENWVGEPLVDYGYVFTWPNEDDDVGACVHIPRPAAGSDRDVGPEWRTMNELLANELIESIECRSFDFATARQNADKAQRFDEANTPFEDADSRIEVFQYEDQPWFCYRVGGSETGPFKTWREAYRAGERHLHFIEARQNADALAAERVEVERLRAERDRQLCEIAEIETQQLIANSACAEVLSSLEWTGDGYAWNPKHGDYRERVIDALDRGKRAHEATLAARDQRIAELEGALKFYATQHHWMDDSGSYSTDSMAHDDRGQRASTTLTPVTSGEQR